MADEGKRIARGAVAVYPVLNTRGRCYRLSIQLPSHAITGEELNYPRLVSIELLSNRDGAIKLFPELFKVPKSGKLYYRISAKSTATGLARRYLNLTVHVDEFGLLPDTPQAEIIKAFLGGRAGYGMSEAVVYAFGRSPSIRIFRPADDVQVPIPLES